MNRIELDSCLRIAEKVEKDGRRGVSIETAACDCCGGYYSVTDLSDEIEAARETLAWLEEAQAWLLEDAARREGGR